MPNPRPPTCPPSYSTAHVARRLGVSVPTVQRWVDLGHLKAWKTVGGHRRIDAGSADRFIHAQAQQQGGEAAVPLRVLVVDAHPDDRERLRALVAVAVTGAHVACAASGFEALIEAGRAVPDLIVVDLALPHMDGVEMIRHLRGLAGVRPPAIVAVSGRVSGPDGLPPGVTLLAKPVVPASFVEAVNQALDANA